MENTFFTYLQRLELMAFFSGYPLIYAVAFFIAGKRPSKNKFKSNLVSLLPFAYALVGTVYLAYQLKSLYPGYAVENIQQHLQQPWLTGYALLSLLFWIPAIAKKTVISLLHSLVFFFFIIKDIFMQVTASPADKNILQNDMKIYTVSIFMNVLSVITIIIIYFLIRSKKKNNTSPV